MRGLCSAGKIMHSLKVRLYRPASPSLSRHVASRFCTNELHHSYYVHNTLQKHVLVKFAFVIWNATFTLNYLYLQYITSRHQFNPCIHNKLTFDSSRTVSSFLHAPEPLVSFHTFSIVCHSDTVDSILYTLFIFYLFLKQLLVSDTPCFYSWLMYPDWESRRHIPVHARLREREDGRQRRRRLFSSDLEGFVLEVGRPFV